MIALAPIAAVVVALLAILFLLAWAEFGKTVAKMFDFHLPVIGNVISDAVSGAINFVYGYLIGWLDSLVSPIANLVAAPINAIFALFNIHGQSLGSIYTALRHLVTVSIPGMGISAIAYAGSAVNGLQTWTSRLVSDTASYLNGQIANLSSQVAGLYNSAVSYAHGLFDQASAATASLESRLTGAISTALNDAKTYSYGLFSQAVASAANQFQHALSYADSLAHQGALDLAHGLADAATYADQTAIHATQILITDVDSAVSTALGAVWPDVLTGVGAVEGVLGVDLPGILSGVRAIPRAIPLDIAGAIAAVGAISIPILRYLEQCGIPNCKNLSSLGRDLQALLSLVGDAAFLAFVLEMIHDPEQGAHLVQDTFGPIINDTLSTARELLRV